MKITILYYHEVVPYGKGYSYQKIEIDKFEQQMRYLSEQGYSTITFDDLDKPLPKKPIIITFDDGFKTVNEYAIPVLEKYGFKSVLFLAPKYIEDRNEYYLTWDELKKLCDDELISVGSHTYSHIDIRAVACTELLEELEKCDLAIRDNLGIESETICFPYGAFNKQAVSCIKEYGRYKYLVASFFGQTKIKHLEENLIQRIGISNDDTFEMFQRKVKGKENYRGIVHLVRMFISNLKKQYVKEYKIDF